MRGFAIGARLLLGIPFAQLQRERFALFRRVGQLGLEILQVHTALLEQLKPRQLGRDPLELVAVRFELSDGRAERLDLMGVIVGLRSDAL